MFLLPQVVELPKEEPEAALRLFADIPGGAQVQHPFGIVLVEGPCLGLLCRSCKLWKSELWSPAQMCVAPFGRSSRARGGR